MSRDDADPHAFDDEIEAVERGAGVSGWVDTTLVTADYDDMLRLLDTAITHGHLVSWQRERRELVARLKRN